MHARLATRVGCKYDRERVLSLFLNSVATTVAHLVSFKVGAVDALCRLSSFATVWQRPRVAVRRMECVIHVTAKVAAAMKPRTSAYEDAAAKPFRTVIARRSAAIGSLVVVTVRTFRSDSDTDADLSLRLGDCCYEAASGNGRYQ